MKTTYFLLLMSVLCLLNSCSSDEESKIYIPEAGTVVNVKFTIKDEPHKEAFHVAVTSESYPAPSKTDISFDIKVYLETDLSLVDLYNAENNTSYPVLPEDCYTIDKEGLIPAGSYLSESLYLTINAKDKITPFTNYLLPVSIQSVEGGNPDDCHQTVYFIISGSYDASDMTFLDRSKWTIVEVSSEELNGEGPTNGAGKYAFDGKGETFWHTQWQGNEPMPPHHITVDMGETTLLQGFSFLTRNFGGAWPKECTVEVSQDGTNWELAANFSDLPAAAATEFRSFFPENKEGRYFRMTITSVYGSSSTHVAEINLF